MLAVTAFLIEQRPDLLGKDKIAFLAGEQARSIGQYARGQNMVLSLFADYPKYLAKKFRENPGKSIEGFAEDMILSYTTQRKLKVDWLILTPELLNPGPQNASFEFYRRLAADPQIHWIACFKDTIGRQLCLGEVKSEGTPLEKARVYEVGPLADIYEKKYNRIGFLKKNIKYILHY